MPFRTSTVVAVLVGCSPLLAMWWPLFLMSSVKAQYSAMAFSISAVGTFRAPCSSWQIRHRYFMASSGSRETYRGRQIVVRGSAESTPAAGRAVAGQVLRPVGSNPLAGFRSGLTQRRARVLEQARGLNRRLVDVREGVVPRVHAQLPHTRRPGF